MQIKTELKTGNRVNVSVNVKEDWQFKYELFNAIIKEVKKDSVIVVVDCNSTHTEGCPFFNGGHFYTQAYNIVKL